MASAMNTETVRLDWVGSVIDGRFTLLNWLGGSGSSGVFLTDLEEHPVRKAAIKLIPADAERARVLLAGWAATAPLSHPHLMRLFRAGRGQVGTTGLVYAVTEYAEEVLSEILPERPLTPDMAREMLDPLLDVLAYLHGKGFAHGHLKPSNLMVVDDRLKLSCDSIHVAGRLGIRPAMLSVYDAPEVAGGTISAATDVWSLGVTLVETLTQQPPAWERTANFEPVVPESVPQPFARIAKECLRLQPAQRCTLSDVEVRLRMDGEAPDSADETEKPKPARLRMAALVAAALVLLVVVAGMLMRSHKPQPSPTAVQQASTAAATPSQAAAPVEKPHSAPPVAQPARGGTAKGAVAGQVMPEVSERARATIEGKVLVTVRVAVDPSGRVTDASLESAGPSKYFANLALQAARGWQFTPAQKDGRPVPSVWILRFQFRRDGTDATPVETSP
jgi:TonB family protein